MSINTKRSLTIALGLIIASGSLVGCASSQEIDRTKRRAHTAMRGPAFKRLVLTYNEVYSLAYRADRYAKAIQSSDAVDPDTQLRASELAEDLAQFADDVEWSLANNQRIRWHRSEMDRLWDQFAELYPEDGSFVDAYTNKHMRKVTRKLDLKNQAEYADLHTYERHNPNWGSLYGTGRVIYERQIEKQD